MIVDAGPLVAIILRTDPHHQACLDCTRQISTGLVTTWPAFTEAVYLLGRRSGWDAQSALLRLALKGALAVNGPDEGMMPRIHELMRKYRDVPMDFADASLVALAEQRGEVDLFTLDSDFEVYRAGRKSFRLWPK